ncbi:MAG: tRNA 2-thiocytidine biosynthesis TtcA family protein [Chlamydiota bacterium]
MLFPLTQLGKKIESIVRKALFDYALLDGAEEIAVALSGGKDSMTLLLMLKAILGRGFPKLPLHAVHVSGEFSCGASVQENFIRSFCERLDIPLTIRQSTQKRETLECYRCSRERRRLIFEAAKEVNAPHIAFGHHRDDSVQTLLLNLLHKGEFAANLPKVPMDRYGITIIRPLLYVSEKAIYEFAKLQGYARLTCQCPVGQDSKRTEVKRLLKEIARSFPNVSTNLAQAARKYGSKKAAKK